MQFRQAVILIPPSPSERSLPSREELLQWANEGISILELSKQLHMLPSRLRRHIRKTLPEYSHIARGRRKYNRLALRRNRRYQVFLNRPFYKLSHIDRMSILAYWPSELYRDRLDIRKAHPALYQERILLDFFMAMQSGEVEVAQQSKNYWKAWYNFGSGNTAYIKLLVGAYLTPKEQEEARRVAALRQNPLTTAANR